MTNNAYTIISLVYNLLVLICFFSKKRINTLENKIYGLLLKINFFNIIFALMSFLTIINASSVPFLNNLVSKTLLVFFALWTIVFTIYIYVISYSKKYNKNFDKKYSLFKKIIIGIFSLVVVCIYALPLYYFGEGSVAYSYGPSANVVYILTTLLIIFWIIMSLSNYKNIRNKKYLPVLMFIVLVILVVIIQKSNPELLLITAMETFITVIMYFTIENPDLYMIDELYKNKTIVEQTYEDKSNFLFEITQKVRGPLFEIHNLCEELRKENDIKNLQKGLSIINSDVKQLDFIVNDVLDVDSLDTKMLKVTANKYNLNNLYNEIVLRVKPCIPKSVEFRSKISDNVPYLYGDSIKLKQIILSLLLNAIKNVSNGYVDFSINTIEKFDACRIIVSIKVSSNELSVDEINDILSSTGELTFDEISDIDKMDMSLKLCQKVIKIFGGTLMIRSLNGTGTEFMLLFDQKLDSFSDGSSILDKYEYYVKKSKTVLIVSSNKELISYLKKEFKSYDVVPSSLMNPKDVVKKINSKKYDYIILDDGLTLVSAFEVFTKLKEIKGFKIPVIVVLDKSKEFIKEHYIADGFSDYILLGSKKDDIQRIVNKY